ncbi:DUF1611 domain-containing protein [Halomicrobium sp. HM KBTZ05]|uniref:DUF1611 domain-containing protein n=1 Tax=Halomicrobium sp. HM KBTZ05 TaxID=3242663 RepID=UPI0035560092
MDIALLAHGQFPGRAKTAVGVLRYGDQNVRAVIDRDTAGDRVNDHVADGQDAPIVESMDDVPAVDALVIGIAPIGGGFVESWRPDVRTAIERGCDVIAGLHTFLADDPEFSTLAEQYDCELRDLRDPPDDLSVADGTAGAVDADVVLTVGTDCSSGKMTASYELRDAARARGIDAAVVPTGQTGVLIEGWGIVVDRVIADFAAGAVERLVEAAAEDHDLLIVEGQGALAHPAYSGVTTSILHGARPDRLVLCHVAGRTAVNGYEDTAIPPVAEYASLYESVAAPVADAPVVAGTLNTQSLHPEAADRAVSTYADELGVPATDPVRFGVDEDLLAVVT